MGIRLRPKRFWRCALLGAQARYATASDASVSGTGCRRCASERQIEAQALVEEYALYAQVRAAVEALPAVERRVVELHFGAGLSERAIARVLGVSKSWVHRRLQSALVRLRADLGVNDEK